MSEKKNKKSIASQALLEMDGITTSIKEESMKSLNALLSEAVRNALREGCENEDEEEDYEVLDTDNENDTNDESAESTETSIDTKTSESPADNEEVGDESTPESESAETSDAESVEEPEVDSDTQVEEPEEAPTEGEGSEWDEFSAYKTDNGSFDLTGVKDYDVHLKAYKLLDDDDILVIRKDDLIKLNDKSNGADYVIDLGMEDSSKKSENPEEITDSEENLNESDSDIAGFDNEEENGIESSDDSITDLIYKLSDQISDLTKRFDEAGTANSTINEKKCNKEVKTKDEVLYEIDLGYTDDYQDKDVIDGLSIDEPSKTGKSWDKGLPTNSAKPWAGNAKDKGKPFDKTIEECGDISTSDMVSPDANSVEEQTNVGGFVQQNSVTISNIPNSKGRKARNARRNGEQVSSTSDNRSAMDETIKKLKKENKELKEAILAIRNNLQEAYVTNFNLGRITKLFLENATSQAEKVDIVNRFSNEAKTIEQSKTLYESIKRELDSSKKTLNINSSMTAKGTKALNEEKVAKSEGLLKTIDLMQRVINL